MKPCRFFQSPINQGITTLTGSEARHVATVLRLEIGDFVELFDGTGSRAQARIEKIDKRSVELSVDDIQTIPPRKNGRIIIAAAVAKGERFDWLIGKCTELGVDHIVPVIYERTVKKSEGKNALARFEKLTISAAKQSGRLFLPQVSPPVPLPKLLPELQTVYPHASWLIGDWGDQATPLATRKWNQRNTIAFIGPEGGMTENEKELLYKFAAQPTCLAETILRVETAAVSFTAILAAQRFAQETC